MTKQNNISFKRWIKQYKNEDNAIGDLARDIYEDSCFPSREKNEENIREYLEDYGACQEALETFEKAFEKYQDSIRFIPST